MAIPTAAGEELVRAANAAGGDDNVTVVLFELVEGEPVPRVPRDAVAVSGGMSTETIDLERTRGGRPPATARARAAAGRHFSSSSPCWR